MVCCLFCRFSVRNALRASQVVHARDVMVNSLIFGFVLRGGGRTSLKVAKMFGFKVLVILTFIVFCDKLVPVTECDSEGVTHHRALAFRCRIQ